MPIYEYNCQDCGKDFEMFRAVQATGLPSCKFCSGKVKKLISVSSFHLKGSGWYVTDYGGKKSTENEDKKEKKSETGTKTEKSESSPKSTDKSSD